MTKNKFSWSWKRKRDKERASLWQNAGRKLCDVDTSSEKNEDE